jgi:uncharacterized protein YjbJ (UPF0337 family)
MQIRGAAQKNWDELTDDDLAQIDGDLDKLVGKLQEKYGYTHEEAQREADVFLKTMDRGLK